MSKFSAMALPVDKPKRMTILHPSTNEPMVSKAVGDTPGTTAYVDVYSSDSDRARVYNRNTSQRRLDMRGRAVVSAISMEGEGFGLLAELTAGWFLVDLDGNPVEIPFTKQAAREMYTDPGMAWLKDQVDAFSGARANFAKPSATSSSDTPSENSQLSAS